MALRNQPYIPLYVQDFLTDEKLMECSAESTGVYIRILCIMHKSDEYGTILLKQKDKQTDKQIENFAIKLSKHLPYSLDVIHKSLHELIEEGVLTVNEHKILQKRMIRDNDISIKRSKAGQKGGFAKGFAKAKTTANSEYESENIDANENASESAKANITNKKTKIIDNNIYIDIVSDLNLVVGTNFKHTSKKTREHINARLKEGFTLEDFKTVHRKKAQEWQYDNKMVKFLRPETLYGTKFESYLNQKEVRTLTKAQQATAESYKRWKEKVENEPQNI